MGSTYKLLMTLKTTVWGEFMCKSQIYEDCIQGEEAETVNCQFSHAVVSNSLQPHGL